MSKKKALIKETVVRRWGKLANIHPLTETFLEDTDLYEQEEEGEELDAEEAGAEDMEVPVEEPGAEEMDAAAPAGEEEAVERIVTAVVDAIADETGVDIEVEGEAGEAEGEMEMEMGEEPPEAVALEEPAAEEEEPAPAGRDMAYNRKDEELNIDMIDDEDLTEAVLKRVVERLLRRK